MFDINIAKELYEKGMGWREIARELDCHPFTVQRALSNIGLSSNREIGRPRNFSLDELLNLLIKGEKVAECARILCISDSSARKGVKRLIAQGKWS